MDLSIVTVNYNTTSHLKDCLDSVIKFTSGIKYEIIVVDNNSPERDIELLPSLYPLVNFYFKEKNEGFGSGCNYGFSKSSGKYILFMNPDVKIHNNLLKDLVVYMNEHLDVAVVSPIYKSEDGAEVHLFREVPGFIWSISESYGSFLYDIYRKLFPFKVRSENEPIDVEWVAGSFLFARSEILKQIHGFDENFFLYYEDIDIQNRIRKNEFRIQYLPQYSVNHFERSSIRSFEGENLYYFQMNRSHLIYIHKHFSFVKRSLLKILHITGIPIRLLSVPLRKDFKGKRKQKVLQLIQKLKQYLTPYSVTEKNKYFNIDKLKNSKKQITGSDEFWK